ncbi:MAG: protein kinase domain-containing protein [Nocardioidaceae bacterium]
MPGRGVPPDPMVGRLLDGRYRVGDKIARGGMASVYEATDLRLDRKIALKVMPDVLADNEDFSQRFVREARAAARLTHPNVVAVYDQGDDNGVLFLAMEYVEGRRTLRDLLRTDAPLSPPRALGLLEGMVQALAAAHESGIIHRDVKPENVLISPRGQVKVADFGLARAISSSTAATATGGVLLGTVSYLAPELVTDGTADARSDVYALGVVLFEMLTGTKPHVGDTPIQVAYKHVHDDVASPSSVVPGLPGYLDAFVARATARQRDLRPADAHVMLQQLRRVRRAIDNGVLDDQELTDDLTLLLLAPAGVAPLDGVAVRVGAPAAGGGSHEIGAHRATGFDPLQSLQPALAELGSRGEPTLVAERFSAGPAGARRQTSRQLPAAAARPPSAAGPSGGPAVHKRWRVGWLALLVVLVLAAGAGVTGWYYGVGRFQNTPDLISLSQQSAKTKLADTGLSLVITTTAYSETVPAGHILSTRPAPGDNVLKHGTVDAILSKGPERHSVPDLDGLTATRAANVLHHNALRVGATDLVWSDTAAKGMVIDFRPKTGTQLRRDAAVTMVVSRGPEPITIPNVVRSSAINAKDTLTSLGFVVDVSQRYDDVVPGGDVVAERPGGGIGHKGDHVALVVSLGPHLVQVPDVRTWRIADAKAALTGAGFKVDVRESSINFGLGFVVKESPGGGSMAPHGSTISVTIV